MARILLVDPSETARRAVRGILSRGEHRFAAVESAAEGWSFLRRNPATDLVFTGLQLEGRGNGLSLVQNLRADPCLNHLPVVVYTAHGDRTSVQCAVALHVQNFLVKPYHDDDIFAEIDKAAERPWREIFFAEETAFCRQTDLTPAARQELLSGLHTALVLAREPLEQAARLRDYRPVASLVVPLRRQAGAAGALVVMDALTRLADCAGEGHWALWPAALAQLDMAALFVADRLGDQRAAPDFFTPAEISAGAEAAERTAWLAAPAEGRCPVLTWPQLQREIEALPGCPVIDSAAASFQMLANGHRSSLAPLMDLVARDPGLSALLLVTANQAHPPASEVAGRIEDARLAVGQLGEERLQALARGLVVTEERVMDLPPAFSWPRFWAFQRGVARIAQLICRELEFHSLAPAARTAGQLHDLGKLILAHLHPAGFQAILEHARRHQVPLAEAERLFLGCTSPQIAAHFAEHFQLSRRFGNVMRWIDDPAAATEDTQLVAILSLARDLCRHNRVGTSGDPVREDPMPIEETAEWRILRESVYPSFNLQRFEEMIHAQCALLCTEISGHQAGTVREIAAHAAV